jgi:PAS domain S-box-containing protein
MSQERKDHAREAGPGGSAGARPPADGFWLVDLEGRFLDVSQSYCDLVGYTREEILGMRVADVEVEERSVDVERHIAKMMAEGGDRFETRHRCKDGRPVEVEVATRYVPSERKIIGFVLDLSARRLEAARRAADERRLAALDRLLCAPHLTVRDLFDDALEESLRLTGSKLGYIYYYDEGRREFTLHSWSRSVMAACSIPDMQRVYQLDKTGLWGEAVRQRRPIVANDFPSPHPHKKGYPEGHAHLQRFMTVPVLVDGRIVAVAGAGNKETPYDDEDVRQLGLFMDALWHFAEREQAEEMHAKLSAVVEQTTASVVIFDAGGVIEYVNDRFVQREGVARPAVMGRSAEEVLMASMAPAQVRELWGALLAGQVWRGEVEHKGAGGRPCWQAVTYLPVRNGAGAITHFAALADDVTERRQLEAELRHAQKLESLGTLASGVAHDFNNILTGLVGLVEAAREQLGPVHPVREDLDEMTGLVDRATKLTRGLLAFGHRQIGHATPLELGEVVDGVTRLLRRIIGEDLKLDILPATHRLPVLADAGQLEQVVTNLVTNARDAMPGGGELTMALSAAEVDEARAARHEVKAGRYAVVSVQDRGCGMDEATRARIFDPFFTTKPVGRGTGLGLSIVYGIVRQAQGFVEVSSAPGEGSRFEVYLPLRTEAVEAPVEPPLQQAALRGHGESILLAEDDPTVRGVWATLLRRNGYLVTTAEDGALAVEAVRVAERPFDLALLDVTMPRLSGPEAFLVIRTLDPRLPVLFASGYAADRVDRNDASSRERLLQKPLAPSTLLWEVQRALQRAAAEAADQAGG